MFLEAFKQYIVAIHLVDLLLRTRTTAIRFYLNSEVNLIDVSVCVNTDFHITSDLLQ